MANKGRSEQGLFGTVHHYDEHGKKVGRSEPGLFGGYTNYDAASVLSLKRRSVQTCGQS